MFSFPSDRSGGEKPSVAPVVAARGYARHHLINASAFWGALLFLSLLGAGFFYAGMWKGYASAGYAVVLIVSLVSSYIGGLALLDLIGQPVSFEGQVSEKSASLFRFKLFFLSDRHYLRIERGEDHRPLAYGAGLEISEGWFRAGKGYHDILNGGDRVRGTVYRRTRLVDSLVKV